MGLVCLLVPPAGILAAQLIVYALKECNPILVLKAVFVSISLAGLLLPYRRFLPRKWPLNPTALIRPAGTNQLSW